MQPQHHVIRNPSPMQQQQAQQPPPSVQQQAAPSQTGVATPVTVAAHQQQGQQQQSPQQQHQQQQQAAQQPSTPNNISNSQSPNQIQPTEIDGKLEIFPTNFKNHFRCDWINKLWNSPSSTNTVSPSDSRL